MGKLSKKKRVQLSQQKRSRHETEEDEHRVRSKDVYGGNDEDYDDDDSDDASDPEGFDQALQEQQKQPKWGKTTEANYRDMEYLERAKLEREKRKDPKFQQQQRLMAALQRKQALDARHEEEMMRRQQQEMENNDDGARAIVPTTKATLETITSQKVKGNAAVAASSTLTSSAMFSHPLLELDEALVDALHRCSFTHLTPIQERVLPFAVQGYDVLGQAKTGSGKTLAFAIPTLQGIMQAIIAETRSNSAAASQQHQRDLSSKHCFALMLAPTKELAHQINSVVVKVSEQLSSSVAASGPTSSSSSSDKKTYFSISSELVTGGTKVQEERNRLLRANIVVGTPGRIADHIKNTAQWNLHMLKFFVLDEVDRMLHEGFAVAVDAIIAALPSTRQTLLFSATSGKAVGSLARLALSKTPLLISEKLDQPQYLREEDREILGQLDHIDLKSGNNNDNAGGQANGNKNSENIDDDDAAAAVASNVPTTLEQYVQLIPTSERLRALYVFCKKVAKTQKAIVFCSTVASATFHCMMMGAAGFHEEVLMLHGKMKHRQRLQVFDAFQSWPSGILFCTDVAARGLDIPHVNFVLQLDPPVDPTEYVHRAGRTARAGAAGKSILFLRPEEKGFIEYARRFGLNLQIMAPTKLPDIQHRLQYILEIDSVVSKAAHAAYQATIGAYESHVLKTIFDPNSLLLVDLAKAFALPSVPLKGVKKLDVDEEFEEDVIGGGGAMVENMTVASRNKTLTGTGGKASSEEDYVKGKFKSLHRRRMQAVAKFHREKTKKQWTDDGKFVGMQKPSARL